MAPLLESPPLEVKVKTKVQSPRSGGGRGGGGGARPVAMGSSGHLGISSSSLARGGSSVVGSKLSPSRTASVRGGLDGRGMGASTRGKLDMGASARGGLGGRGMGASTRGKLDMGASARGRLDGTANMGRSARVLPDEKASPRGGNGSAVSRTASPRSPRAPPMGGGGGTSSPSPSYRELKGQLSSAASTKHVFEPKRRRSSHEIRAELEGGGKLSKKRRKHPIILFFKRLFAPKIQIELCEKAQELMDKYHIEAKYVRDLKFIFDSIDVDGSGTMDCAEFLAYVDVPKGPFSDFIFQFGEVNPRGSMNFDGMVRIVVTYCMFSRDEILRFCFNQFDIDGSGAIDEQEFVELLRVVNNATPMFPGNYGAALEQFDANNDGLLDFEEFREIDRRFPLLLFPAYRLQDALQKKFLGETIWTRIRTNNRKIMLSEEYALLHGGSLPDSKTLKSLLARPT